MKLIPLSTRNKCKNYGKYFAQVDDDLFDYLNQFTWLAKEMTSGTIYAAMHDKIDRRKFIYMHRLIMNAQKGQEVDHINYDGLCNLHSNLRLCTHAENNRNRKKVNKPTSSRHIGVCWDKSCNMWQVSIKLNGKEIFIGYFKDEDEAGKARDKRAKELHGSFAVLNFPE